MGIFDVDEIKSPPPTTIMFGLDRDTLISYITQESWIFYIRVIAVSLEIIATILLTTHVLFIHNKLRVRDQVVLSGNEKRERVFIIVTLVFYIIGFLLAIVAEIADRHVTNARISALEKRV
jgi:hypothetical protein